MLSSLIIGSYAPVDVNVISDSFTTSIRAENGLIVIVCASKLEIRVSH